MTTISLHTGIEEMSLFTAADDHRLPLPKPFLTPGVQVTSYLRQLYKPRMEWALLDAFIKPEMTSCAFQRPAEFERRFHEVRHLLKRISKESPEDAELFEQADSILDSGQKGMQCLARYRNALIGA